MSKLTNLVRLSAVFLFAMVSAASAADYTYVSEEDREGLEPSSATRLDELLVRPDADFSSYGSLFIAPVEFPLSKEFRTGQPRLLELREGDKKALERSLRTAFINRFENGIPIVEEVGEDTLVLQIGITEVLPNRDITGSVSTDGRRPDVTSRSVGIGRATMEAVFTSGGSDEIVAVAFDSYVGASLNTNPNASTRWGDVRTAFRRWAREISKLFEE